MASKNGFGRGARNGHAQVEAIIDYPAGLQPLRHRIEFTETASRLELLDEVIENRQPSPGDHDPFFYYRFQNGHPLSVKGLKGDGTCGARMLPPMSRSCRSERTRINIPRPADLAQMYGKVRVYREWSFGRTSVFRNPQSADLPSDRLEEDFSKDRRFARGGLGTNAAHRDDSLRHPG